MIMMTMRMMSKANDTNTSSNDYLGIINIANLSDSECLIQLKAEGNMILYHWKRAALGQAAFFVLALA